VSAFVVILVAGAVSYAFRLVPAALVDRVRSIGRLDRAATYVVPATFAAVAASGVLARTDAGAGTLAALPPVAAVLVAVAAARRTGSSLAAVAAGLPTLWVLTEVVRP
jgi:branched-subunit amino acid transport protein